MKRGSLIDRNENIWNVPNLLTMLRMAGVAVFIALFALDKMTAAMIVFILAACTDALDGYIARKYHLITSFGKLMDPLADKLMTLSALVCLTVKGLVPVWLLVIEGTKEVIMVCGGIFVLRKKKMVVQADFIGKAATVTFIAAIVATFLHDVTAPWDFALQCGAVTLAVAAMVFYVADTVRKVRASEKEMPVS